MKLDVSSPLALAQLDANHAFAEAYAPRATPPERGATRPRAFVSGFGRFLSHHVNASGAMVCALLDDLDYPFTEPPPPDQIDPPGPQLAVARGIATLPGAGEVDLCVMVLPVSWDLAAYLALREIEAFVPDVVVMNGVAGPRQELWLELGALNAAKARQDGSGHLVPAEPMTPVVPAAAASERRRHNLASWPTIAGAAEAALAAQAHVRHASERLDAILHGVAFAGVRDSNSYLCNATTYAVGYALDHPGEAVGWLTPAPPIEQRPGLPHTFATTQAVRWPRVPRWFMHWPSELAGAHLSAASDVLRAVIGAQLAALADGPAPTRGDRIPAARLATPPAAPLATPEGVP